MDVIDNKTSQTIDEIKNEFMAKYDVLNEYIEKGYDIKPVYYVENNIEKKYITLILDDRLLDSSSFYSK